MNEPCDLGAAELRRRIGSRELSPRELLRSCLKRIEETNPRLNAFVHMCTARAEREAEEAERAVLNGESLGLLHGLPLGVKDLNHVAGLPTTFGSPLFANDIPEADEGVVARMRAEGAIVVGKTNVPEHGFGATTDNPLFGTTNNPFDPALSRRGRHRCRQDQCTGARIWRDNRQSPLRNHQQPVRPGAQCRRLIRRNRGRACVGDGAAGDGVGFRRQPAHAGILLRDRRVPALARRRGANSPALRLQPLRCRGAHGTEHRGLPVAARCHGPS